MTKFIRHVGKNHLGSKVVIVFREIPDDLENCLVVESQSLSDMYHDNLMRIVESNAAQETVNLYEVLARSYFGDGQQMLNALHNSGRLKKYSVDQIKVEPMPNRSAPLREVNAAIREGNADKAMPAKPAQAPVAKKDSPVLVDTSPVEASEDQKKATAESKLLQARLMEEDAEKLRQEAYTLDPNLKKGGRPSKKQQEVLDAAKE